MAEYIATGVLSGKDSLVGQQIIKAAKSTYVGSPDYSKITGMGVDMRNIKFASKAEDLKPSEIKRNDNGTLKEAMA